MCPGHLASMVRIKRNSAVHGSALVSDEWSTAYITFDFSLPRIIGRVIIFPGNAAEHKSARLHW